MLENQETDKEMETMIEKLEREKIDNRIYLTGNVASIRVNFLYYPGSQVSIISSTVSRMLGLNFQIWYVDPQMEMVRIRGINADSLFNVLCVTMLPLVIGHISTQQCFYVIQNNSKINILGMDWWKFDEAHSRLLFKMWKR